MTTTSRFKSQLDDIKGNRFILDGVLYGVYDFVDAEGFKSQTLATVEGTNITGYNYSFFCN